MLRPRIQAVAHCLLALFCLLAAGSATAQPYEFLAVYEPTTGGGEARTVRLDVGQGALLPDGGEGFRLDRLVARIKSDAISVSTLDAFKKLVFTVSMGGGKLTEKELAIDGIEKLPSRELTLMAWRGDGKTEALSRVEINVRSIYLGTFLCLQELALLGDEHRSSSVSVPLTPLAVKNAVPAARRSVQVEDGPKLLFSFCHDAKGESRNKQLDWSAALKRPEYTFSDPRLNADAGTFRQAHKQALAQLIVEQLNNRFAVFGRADAVETKDEGFDNVLVRVEDGRAFSIIKSAGSLMLIEEAGGEVQRLADIIDQDSEVALALDREVCFQLPPGAVMNTPWVFELEVPDGKDGKTRKAKVDLDFRHGCNRMLLVPWKDYLNQRVIFRIIYRVPEREDIIVFKDSFHIYNLGLITTAPVITEIVSAYQQAAPNDVEATSSIPVSFALPVDGERRSGSVAVTFPFTLSFNTRTFPNLAEYFAVAPSVSLLGGGNTEPKDLASGEPVPADQGPNVRLALGVGVNLARAFHFGYAWAPSDGGRYVLIGISVPDLLPLLKKNP